MLVWYHWLGLIRRDIHIGRDEKIFEEKILNTKQEKVPNAFSQTRTEKHSSLGLASCSLDLGRQGSVVCLLLSYCMPSIIIDSAFEVTRGKEQHSSSDIVVERFTDKPQSRTGCSSPICLDQSFFENTSQKETYKNVLF